MSTSKLSEMKQLTEETVKKATLAFLKTYYKHRPRAGDTVSYFNMRTEKGHIVDGYLTFPKPDGTPFIATFEATGADTPYEVVFSRRKTQLNWDAFALSSVLTMLSLLWAWSVGAWTLAKVGGFQTVVLILLSLSVWTLGFIMFCKRLPRYRQIYAVEQFKQYFADEQWIAISHDVFPNVNDIAFAELKKQCVRNGFGLVRVDKEEHLEMLITPAREEIFGKKRGMLAFVESSDANNVAVNTVKVMSKPFLLLQRAADKFNRPYSVQKIVSFASCFVLTSLLFTQARKKPVVNLSGNQQYQDSLQRAAAQMRGEDKEYLYYPEYGQSKPNKNTQSYQEVELSVESAAQQKGNFSTAVATDAPPEEIGLYVYSAVDKKFMAYPCSRTQVVGERYIVQEGIYPDFVSARARIDALFKQNMFVNCISLSCSNEVERGYAVYFDLMFNDIETANALAVKKIQEFEKANLMHDIKIRKL